MVTPPGSQEEHNPGGFGASYDFLDEDDDGGGRYQARLCV